MSNLHRALIVGATLALGACTVACAGTSDEPSKPVVAVKELKEGLTIMKTDGILSGAFRRGDRAIFFETRRGAPTLDVYRDLDKSLGAFETDARVLDEDGRTVYVRMGGDTLDPAWELDLEREAKLPMVDPLRRAESFELIKAASDELAKADLPIGVAFEAKALTSMKLAVYDELLRPAVEKSIKEVGYAPANNTVEIHGQWIIWGVAEHSATWRNINGTVYDACNHGSCASAMSHWCTASGSNTSNAGNERSTSNSSVTANCSTGYNWNSTGGGHNCHDDSVRTLWNQKYGPQGASNTGVCNNGTSHWYGPSCGVTSW